MLWQVRSTKHVTLIRYLNFPRQLGRDHQEWCIEGAPLRLKREWGNLLLWSSAKEIEILSVKANASVGTMGIPMLRVSGCDLRSSLSVPWVISKHISSPVSCPLHNDHQPPASRWSWAGAPLLCPGVQSHESIKHHWRWASTRIQLLPKLCTTVNCNQTLYNQTATREWTFQWRHFKVS